MVQLWVNLPAKDKTRAALSASRQAGIPVVEFPDEAGRLRLIAGEYKGENGAADTFTEMNVWDIVLNAGKKAVLEIPETHNLSMVVLRATLP